MDKITCFVTICILIGVTMMMGKAAYATNESSYKFGREQGSVEWQTCQNPDADCETPS